MRRETAAAIRAAQIAIGIADSRTGANQLTSKGGINLVTATDLTCEDAIREELARSFPYIPIIGEERAGEAVAEKPYWLVDPICGTRPYASNIPLYCTNIALVENGCVTVAAVGIGKTDEILFAERGGGAWLRTSKGDERIHVADDSHSIWVEGRSATAAAIIGRAMVADKWYILQFASSLSYTYLAMGKLSGVIVTAPPPPEVGSVHNAAGCFVALEAGAIITDLNTLGPWTLQSGSFVMASSTEVHEELLQLL